MYSVHDKWKQGDSKCYVWYFKWLGFLGNTKLVNLIFTGIATRETTLDVGQWSSCYVVCDDSHDDGEEVDGEYAGQIQTTVARGGSLVQERLQWNTYKHVYIRYIYMYQVTHVT